MVWRCHPFFVLPLAFFLISSPASGTSQPARPAVAVSSNLARINELSEAGDNRQDSSRIEHPQPNLGWPKRADQHADNAQRSRKLEMPFQRLAHFHSARFVNEGGVSRRLSGSDRDAENIAGTACVSRVSAVPPVPALFMLKVAP